METVHVLGDDHHRGGGFQAGESLVGGVGFGSGDEAAAPVIPTPDQFGITGEGAGRSEILGSVPAPQAVLFAPEGGDAAGGGNTRTRQNRDPGFRRYSVPDPFEFCADVRIHNHNHLLIPALPDVHPNRIMNDADQLTAGAYSLRPG